MLTFLASLKSSCCAAQAVQVRDMRKYLTQDPTGVEVDRN